MIYIDDEHRRMVANILDKHVPDYEVKAFGSRVHGRHLWKFSDLDLAVMNHVRLPDGVIADLKEAFSESTLPFRVDVLDWAAVSENFRKIIEENYEVIHTPTR